MSTYRNLLKDPRWQKRRLEVMARDEWTCKGCGSTTETLNVHHINYVWGGKPWEAEDDDLVTLCEGCHELEEELKHYALINDVAKAAKVTNIKLWLAASAIGYLKICNPKAFEEVIDLLNKNTFDYDQKDFSQFINSPSKYIKGKN